MKHKLISDIKGNSWYNNLSDAMNAKHTLDKVSQGAPFLIRNADWAPQISLTSAVIFMSSRKDAARLFKISNKTI